MSEKKERIAFFDTKPYDRVWFDQLNRHYHIKYYEHKLTGFRVTGTGLPCGDPLCE